LKPVVKIDRIELRFEYQSLQIPQRLSILRRGDGREPEEEYRSHTAAEGTDEETQGEEWFIWHF